MYNLLSSLIDIRRVCWLLTLALWLLSLATVSVATAAELRVVATIRPVHSLLSALMVGIEPPQLLIDGSPHLFKADSETQRVLAASDVIVWVGPELEGSLQATIAGLGDGVRVVELLSNPNLKILSKRDDEGQRDPYFWLDSRNALILLDDLAQLLIDIDPVRAHLYISNHRQMQARLRRLDREFEYGYRGLQEGLGYQYHDTQQYFEQAYALRMGGRLLPHPHAVADAKELLRLRSQLASGQLGCLLTERGMPDSNLSLVVPEGETRIWQLDSLGLQFTPGPELYPALMRYNSSVMQRCYPLNQGGLDPITPVAVAPAVIDGPGRFIMINQLGEVVTAQDMLGSYQLLFFGYTSCPDICPLSLQTLTHALAQLGALAAQFQPYFVTVDPERDDVATLYRYVRYFDERIIGLTGSQAMLKQMAQHYGVHYRRVAGETPASADYQMDHSAGLWVVAPDGTLITKLAHGISATDMALALRALVS